MTICQLAMGWVPSLTTCTWPWNSPNDWPSTRYRTTTFDSGRAVPDEERAAALVLVRVLAAVPVLVSGTVLAVGPVRGVGAWPGGRVEGRAARVRRGRLDGVAGLDGLRTVACPDGLPSGAADHGVEAWGARPPAAPC